MKKISTVLVGIIFVIAGVIIGLNSFGITDINIFFDGWWTLFIIIPAINGFITDEEKMGSIIWLIIGIVLLLGCQNLISFDIIWKLTLPVILVFIGLSIICGTLLGYIVAVSLDFNSLKSYCNHKSFAKSSGIVSIVSP